jgi:predicted SAM-dependent methyltransferase
VSLKLNLGAGHTSLDAYLNVDRCYPERNTDGLTRGCWQGDVFPLDFEDGSVDEVRASHVLEHFSHRETLSVITDWVRVLKPGGTLKVAVPNFRWIAQQYLAGADIPVNGYVMGGHVDDNDHHGAIFDEEGLRASFEELGLVDIQYWVSEIHDCAALPVSLNLMGRKPLEALSETFEPVADASESIATVTADATEPRTEEQQAEAQRAAFFASVRKGHPDPRFAELSIPPSSVMAVMTTPRLGFTSFFTCALDACSTLGIPLKSIGGAYWDQGLERAFEFGIAAGAKYLLSIDYDTLFSWKDIQTLYGIMEARTDIGALCPVQMRREMPVPLLTIRDENDTNVTKAPWQVFETDVTAISTGHFGLTMLRVESVATIKKPWFHSVPDPDGGWGDARQDADIAFWYKGAEAGLKLYQANRVSVGHLELMVTWPNVGFRPIFQYASDYHEHGRPAVAWPADRKIGANVMPGLAEDSEETEDAIN